MVETTIKALAYKVKWGIFHPGAESFYLNILENERKSVDELFAIQESLRQKIVLKAFQGSRFYRKHYGNEGFDIVDIGKNCWFEKLPVVTKADLRNHFDEFINPAERQFLKVSTTGGSTGEPTKTGYDGRIPEEIYSWRLQNRFGVHPWDDHAYVWRDTRKSRFAKLKNAAMWWPTRHLKLDATFITENAMGAFIVKFNKLKPSMLQGYVGAITQLAQYVLDNQLKVYSPRFVWTTSAPLPQAQRRLISEAFGAPVCDEYGSCELRWIASQCPEGKGLHVNIEHVHIEFVDECNMPVPTGEYGKTLVTNLEDTVFPLIRYENGDRGRWLSGQCSCGRALPVIDSVKGRESENFRLPSGKIINGEYLTTIFDENPALVKGFRVVQHKNLDITIEYEPSGDERQVLEIVDKFRTGINSEVVVTAKRVSAILSDRGKQRYVVREQ